MTDADIISIFSNKNGQISASKCSKKWLDKHLDITNYLQNRYTVFIGYKETLQGIFNHLDVWPICQNCGKPLSNIFKTWCNVQCQLTDPKFIQYRNSVIDETVKVQKFHETCMKKWGVMAPAQNKEIMQKMVNNHDYVQDQKIIKMHNLEKYGYENVLQVPEIIEKAMQTKLKNRPNDPTNHKKQEQTMLEKYNIKSALCNGQFRDKGYDTYKQNPELRKQINNKIKQTKLEKYGNENYNNSKKHAETCLDRYGTPSYSQTDDYISKLRQIYMYNNETFDSSWELAYYIWNKDQNNDIKRNHCSFTYNYNNEIHYYFPDFMVNGQLIEIKGDHFFKNEKMINPFDRSQDGLYEAKHQCALQNNVQILRSDKIIPIIEYIESTYGKNYLDKWKINK